MLTSAERLFNGSFVASGSYKSVAIPGYEHGGLQPLLLDITSITRYGGFLSRRDTPQVVDRLLLEIVHKLDDR